MKFSIFIASSLMISGCSVTPPTHISIYLDDTLSMTEMHFFLGAAQDWSEHTSFHIDSISKISHASMDNIHNENEIYVWNAPTNIPGIEGSCVCSDKFYVGGSIFYDVGKDLARAPYIYRHELGHAFFLLHAPVGDPDSVMHIFPHPDTKLLTQYDIDAYNAIWGYK